MAVKRPWHRYGFAIFHEHTPTYAIGFVTLCGEERLYSKASPIRATVNNSGVTCGECRQALRQQAKQKVGGDWRPTR